MARPNQALGRRSKLALVEEAVARTLELHATGDFLRHLGASMQLPRNRELHADVDKGVAASAFSELGIEAKLGFPAYVRPSGAVGGAAELDAVLKGAFGATSTPGATTEDGGSSTTELLDVVDASAYTAGDILWLVTTGEAVQIESIAANAITPTIPMSAAPTANEVVNSGKQFTPADDLPTFSAYVDDDHVQRAAAGAIINGLSVSFAANELLRATIETDLCGKRSLAGTAALEGVHNIAAGTLTLEPGQGARFSVDGGNIRVTVDPGGANEETHTVDGVSGDDLSLVGTLANEQADATEVSFYSITPTHTGTPVSGIHGAAVFDLVYNSVSTRFACPLRACDFKLTNGYVLSADYGSEFRNVAERENENPREALWTPTLRLTQQAVTLFGLADQFVSGAILVWAGNSAGNIFALGSRKVQWEIPEFETPPGGLGTLKINGRALESSDGQADEVRGAYL